MEMAIEKAIRILGGASAAARIFCVTPWAVSKWTKKVPAERCRAIEAATGGQVTRYDLRPDVFGDNPQPETQQEAA